MHVATIPTSRSNAGFRGRRALLLAASFAVTGAGAMADGPYYSFEPAVTWQDNVTNAPAGEGVLSAFSTRVSGRTDWLAAPDFSTTLSFGVAAEGEVWARYVGLDNLSVGPRAELRHKLGLGAYATVVSIGLEADDVVFYDSDRTALQGVVDVGCSQRISDAFQVEMGAKFGGAEARQTVFSGDYARIDGALNWDLDETWRIKLMGGWREGAVVTDYRAQWYDGHWVTSDSYGAGEPGTFPASYPPSLYGPWRFVGTFNEPFLAFRLHGTTWNYGLGLEPALGPRTTLVVRFNRSITQMSEDRYANDLVSVAVVRHF